MGRGTRQLPKKLGGKLKKIRLQLGLTQGEMAEALNKRTSSRSIHQAHVSGFERGEREPSLLTLVTYARLGGVTVDYLADDTARA
ncbi:MAG: helix-turn-helix domain-containing protein [Blastocatellia bacterium]